MEKIWLNSYQLGVPHEIHAHAYSSLAHFFEEKCRQFKHRTAFINFGTRLSFSELERQSRFLASYLQNVVKLKPGSRVAVMLPNILQYPIAVFGILRAGMVIVNINVRYKAPELKQELDDSGAEGLIIFSTATPVLSSILHDIQLKTVIVTEIGDLFQCPKNIAFNLYTRFSHRKPSAIPHAITFNSALDQGKQLKFNRVDLTLDDLAFLQYTGGTTGIPKGAMLTHGSMIANILQLSAFFKPMAHDEELIVTALPLCHIFALTANCLTFLELGCANLLITDPTNIAAFIKQLSHYRFTVFVGLNTLFLHLLKHPKFAQLDFSSLHLTFAGGMPTQASIAQEWQRVTGVPIIEGYGLTEASPAVVVNPMNNTEFSSTIGVPLPSTEVSVRDDAGHELGCDVPGELWIRGPQVMLGYWCAPEETQQVLSQDGWLRTGDIVTINSTGFIRIVDRKKEMILVSGFNVYPSEIEAVIAKHPGVLEVAVIGVPDETTGEKLKAVIVKKQPNLTEQDIIDFCHPFLTRYKIPHSVEFRESLPKSMVGKVLKRAL